MSSIANSFRIEFPYKHAERNVRLQHHKGTRIGYKYIDLEETGKIEVVYQTDAPGELEIYTEENGERKAVISLKPCKWWKTAETEVTFTEEKKLYLVYKGEGVLSLLTLNLKGKRN